MIAPPMTRRTAMGTGLALLSVVGTAHVGVYGRTAASEGSDALLIDGGIAMPQPVTAFIEACRQATSVVEIRLDAAAYSQLKHIFSESRVITGVTSGATLFCLERIAWDHGFRLTARTQRSDCNLDSKACARAVTEFLAGAYPAAMHSLPAIGTYRPSQMDGTLHAWTMHKSARSHFSLDWREA